MDLMLDFVEVLAWPIVVLVGVLILGPGGILMEFANSLGKSVSDFTRSLPELNKTALTMRSDVETLVEKSRQMSNGFATEFSGIESRLDALIIRATSSMNEMKAVLEDLDRSKIEEDRLNIDQATEVLAESSFGNVEIASEVVVSSDTTPEEMLVLIKATWTQLVEALRDRAGNLSDFDARQVGGIASRMADRRRSNPISREAADLVQALHTQFKRFSRMSGSVDEWLTVDQFDSFERGVQKAISSIRS